MAEGLSCKTNINLKWGALSFAHYVLISNTNARICMNIPNERSMCISYTLFLDWDWVFDTGRVNVAVM